MDLKSTILSKTLTVIRPSSGTELVPLTRSRPQALLPFGPESCVIDFTIANLRKSGLGKAFVLVERQALAIQNYLDRADSGVTLVTLGPDRSASYRSSVDLFQSVGLLRVEQPDYVLVLPTNQIYEMDYEELLQFHVRQGGEITIVTSGAIDVGIYIFNAGMFRRVMLLSALTDHEGIGRTVIGRAADSRDIRTYDLSISSGRHWGAIDSIDAYYLTQLRYSGARVGVVSRSAHISPFAAVTDSILMKNVHVGAEVRIRKAIVEEELRIPEGTVIGFDREADRRRFAVTSGGVVIVDRTAIDRMRPAEHSLVCRLSRAA